MRSTKKWKAEIFVALLLTMGGVVMLALALLGNRGQDRRASGEVPAQVIHVPIESVIGRRGMMAGSVDAPYTLVEFGDYECPPCRRANLGIQATLPAYHRQITLQFRNYPLLTIHPLAHAAAVVAEVARLKGQFWNAHDALYAGELTSDRIRQVTVANNLTGAMNNLRVVGKADAAIDVDVRAANALGVSGTPTFFLCCPGDKIVRLGSWQQFKDYVPAPS